MVARRKGNAVMTLCNLKRYRLWGICWSCLKPVAYLNLYDPRLLFRAQLSDPQASRLEQPAKRF
jgi:hypothetical protein